MNTYKELKKSIIEPTLKGNNFKKLSNIWYHELKTGIIHIVEIGNRTIVVNDFALYINFGIFYQGVMELTYGFDSNLKNGIANCMFKSYMKKQEINQQWNSNDFQSYETFAKDVSNSLESSILPFLNSITTGEELLALFQEDITYYIKNDSILALQIACLNFLLGKKERGKEIVKMAISNSKEKYEFAEQLLNRMERFDTKELGGL